MPSLEPFMKEAIAEARVSLREGNHGFGAVIVRENRIIASAHDTEETDADPTAHAESTVIRRACGIIGKDLSSCTLVCTHEPCPMCAGAIVWARIPVVAFGYAIADAVAQGRSRMEIPCEEIFARSGRGVVVEKGVLGEECSVLYNRDVRSELAKLRGASDEQLRACDTALAAKRTRWYHAHYSPLRAGDPLDRAYHVLLRKLGITEEQAPMVRRDATTLVFHSRNFCPTLEACMILGLDSRKVCKSYNERSTDELVRQVDPRLSFSRNYERMRPSCGYCEESITYTDRAD